ncbi:MAG: riboflavin synthase [Bacteriovoracaceae bacterium]|nr:riboflavin synthase [Bacteriovoracaceae bacterium]
MFTGLIKDIGTIESVKSNSEGKEFVIRAPELHQDIQIDDSVSTNGVCLTATEIKGETFKIQAVHVTLEKTNIGKLRQGDKVNLELALRPMDRLGGHFVQGHVNGIGAIKNVVQRGKNWEISIEAQKDLFRYIIQEGSIAVDGISLTVARLKEREFTVSIIPHTYENTILHTKKIGDSVNIEVDMMAKYLENFLQYDKRQTKFEQLVKDA